MTDFKRYYNRLSGDIPVKIIKIAKVEIAEPITYYINSSI